MKSHYSSPSAQLYWTDDHKKDSEQPKLMRRSQLRDLLPLTVAWACWMLCCNGRIRALAFSNHYQYLELRLDAVRSFFALIARTIDTII